VSINVSPTTMSVSTNVTVWPAIAGQLPLSPLTTNPANVVAGQTTQVTWTLPAGATTCTLSSNASLNGGGSFTSGTTSVAGPVPTATQYQATYTSTTIDSETNGGVVTFSAACASGASPGIGQVTVTPAPVAVMATPSSGVAAGDQVTINWTPPAQATVCGLSSDGPGGGSFSGTFSVDPATGAALVATYTVGPNDWQNPNNIVDITGSCSTGATPGVATITVTPPP
jgi:hypothetical protein